jgi:DMSO/TMAO reductase YedYZ molybdopterin-dependent catalytic subunit
MATGADTGISVEELQLAARNHGMPLEALRSPITPAGLHYLLIHFDVPLVDPATWQLEVSGEVEWELALSLAELRRRPLVERTVTMECAGNGRARLEPHVVSQPWLSEAIGTARWSGAGLRQLLDEAGLTSDAVELVFEGLDRGIDGGEEQAYARSLRVDDPALDDAVLAYEMNGEPLLPQHGFPLRLVVPGWYGMTNVKWLTRIVATARPFEGYQQARAYRFRRDEDDPGTPITRMLPRALLAPPGIPDFLTRERTVPFRPCTLEGRAWSGYAPIERVELSADDGATWAEAALDDDLGSPWAWRRWTTIWEPRAPGRYILACRATDGAGNVQPLEPVWNVGGYSNNAVHRVPVNVAD